MNNLRKQSNKPDPRINPWRDDLAADHLRGEVDAPKFVKGKDFDLIAPVANIHKSPAHGAMVTSQLLFGERFRVYDIQGDWAWGQCQFDDYVGYVLAEDLGKPQTPTHWVSALRAHIYDEPNIKSRPLMAVSYGAKLVVIGTEGKFYRVAGGSYIFRGHVASLDEPVQDYIASARRFIGTPYLWGGRESLGIDCSGLVQVNLMQAGLACPRDTDMQQASLGEPVIGDPQKGDIIFWKGHVGLVSGDDRLLHANATFMEVVEENLSGAIARIAETDGPVTAIKRLKH